MRILFLFTLFMSIISCGSFKKLPSEIKYKDFVQFDSEDSIYYSKFEVTNNQYRQFLNDIKNKDFELYNKCKVHSEGWTNGLDTKVLGKPFQRNYYSHIQFDNYPIVNISFEGATEYCKWLNNQSASRKNKLYFRLPSLSEFNVLLNSISIKYDSDELKAYKISGEQKYRLNFNLKFEGNYPADGGFFTVLANNETNQFGNTKKQYVQNKYGIQHIIGNVHELLDNGNYTGGGWNSFPSEVRTEHKFKEPNPTVGFRIVMVKNRY